MNSRKMMASIALRLDRKVFSSVVMLAQIAAGSERLAVLKALFGLGFAPESVPGGLLCLAVRTQSLRSVEALLTLGLSPDQPDATGKTPLMWASRYDDGDIAAVLLNAGANLKLKDDGGRNALDYARFHEAEDVYAVIQKHMIATSNPTVRAAP